MDFYVIGRAHCRCRSHSEGLAVYACQYRPPAMRASLLKGLPQAQQLPLDFH